MRLYIAILTLALQQQCSMVEVATKGSEGIRAKAEQGLKPYFPRAHTVVSGNMLLGFTCADLGDKAIAQLPASLDTVDDVRLLKGDGGLKNTLGGVVVSLTGIRTFALGFPSQILQLDLSTKQYRMVPANTVSGYIARYSDTCNAPSQEQASGATVAPVNNAALVYVGTFRATVTQADGTSRMQTITDSLGVYTPADFERNRAVEVAAREPIIREELARSGLTLSNLELIAVKTTPIP